MKELECVMEIDEQVVRVFLRVYPDGEVNMWVDDDLNDLINDWADYAAEGCPEVYYTNIAAYQRKEAQSVKAYFAD